MNKTTWLLIAVVLVLLAIIVRSEVKHNAVNQPAVPAVDVPDLNVPLVSDWERDKNSIAEDVLGVGTILTLKKQLELGRTGAEWSCVHDATEDGTAIVTFLYRSLDLKRTLPITTPLTVKEVLSEKNKLVAEGRMEAAHELTFKVETSNGSKFDVIYDVGENMKASSNCSHTGRPSPIKLSDLEKMFDVVKYVPSHVGMVTTTK